MKYSDVILPIPLRSVFTYEVPNSLDSLTCGMRVIVPFGSKKIYTGIVYRIHDTEPQTYRAKPILEVLDLEAIISPKQFDLWSWIADYYCASLGDVMNAALPSALKLSSQTKIHKITSHEELPQLKEKEKLVLKALEQHSELSFNEVSKLLGQKSIFPVINALIANNLIGSYEEVSEKYKPKRERFVTLVQTGQDFQKMLSKAPKQWELVQYFIQQSSESQNPMLSVQQLIKGAHSTYNCLNTLVKKGVFELYEMDVSRLNDVEFKDVATFELSPEQQSALTQIKTALKKQSVALFHGVTSSGKTEVLVELIKEVIDGGKQVLYLLPEIALTTQLIRRLRQYFGDKITVYHSRFSVNERVEIWNEVKNTNRFSLILGTRSSLFLPFKELGLIIVDEEHEITFKQQHSSPRYNARDTAIKYAQIHNAKVVLASATPSIESYYNAQTEKYALVELSERYGGLKLPEIEVVDIKYLTHRKLMKGAFSPNLLSEISLALEKQKQVILFQNRRGFAPQSTCKTCSWTASCKSCDVSLTYHKSQNVLKCHYCGYTESIVKKCKSCGSFELEIKGYGTEKLEEELQPFFPNSFISRLDLDSTRRKNAYEKIITDFENGKIDILVGTQMITKGLDFKNVSLVGIMNADGLLNFPDFRSFERSFQLMTQVAGRAGRKDKQGKVLIQTYSPDHDIIHGVQSNDYRCMYDAQTVERKHFNYPPFCKLISISVKHRDMDTTNQAARELALHLRSTFHNQVLGPEYPPVARIKNRYIKNILVKIVPGVSLKKSKHFLMKVIESVKQTKPFSGVRFDIDVDPF